MTKRKVFFSFHFAQDYWRVQQIRNMNALEGNKVVTENKWEEIKKDGDQAIKNWIDENMKGKSCLVVLIGEQTGNRKYVKYEIQKAWDTGKAILGIHINKLLNNAKPPAPSRKGFFSFDAIDTSNSTSLFEPKDSIVIKTPSGNSSTEAYADISESLADWVEEAITLKDILK